MDFSITHSVEILERTPKVLHELFYNLDSTWSVNNEGAATWSPFDVLGHLIYCDQQNWIPRLEILLSDKTIRKFQPFDKNAQLNLNTDKSMNRLVSEFENIRSESLLKLKNLNITPGQFEITAIHPDLGTVKLSQLVAAWVAHDLAHIAQIARVMAKQYKEEVGPWKNYMHILNQ